MPATCSPPAGAAGVQDKSGPATARQPLARLASQDKRGPGATPPGRPLRAWQRSALARYLAARPQDFLAVATPGAGKTAFALRVAAELLADRTITAITVVTPTEHLKHAVGGGRGVGRDRAGPGLPQLDRRDVGGLHRHRDHLRRRRRPPDAAPQPHGGRAGRW